MIDPSPQSSERFCLFRSGTSWFALPAMCVQEVSFRPPIIPVPATASVLAGLCHFRNEFLAVLSLRRLLPASPRVASRGLGVASRGIASRAIEPESQILVVQRGDGPWALLVDSVAALETLDASPSQEAGDDGWADVVTGWATFRDHSVRILDPDTFYELAHQALQECWASTVCATAPPQASKHGARNVERGTDGEGSRSALRAPRSPL